MLTWGVMVFEYLLSTALVMPRRYWKLMLFSGMFFHGSILCIQGISSFSVAMMAALLLYLRPWDQPFAVPARLRRWQQRLAHSCKARPLLSTG
jgi:hypothetical protein